MELATIHVSGVDAKVVQKRPVPVNIIGGYVDVIFDDDWEGLIRTAVIQGAKNLDIVNVGSRFEIPQEAVSESDIRLRVGFYGVSQNGGRGIPTLWADLGVIQDAADPSGDESTDPALPVWAQLQALIGDLNDLDTTAKETIVAAINEALTRGGADPVVIGQIVEDYLEKNPPKESVFIAKYSKTTNAEIEAARNAGKACYVLQGMAIYPCIAAVSSSRAVFGGTYMQGWTVITCDNDVWARQNIPMVEAVSAESTHVEFPTAKAVFDFVAEVGNGKLDATELPTAINEALAQAKASGEFKGEPGQPGEPGKDYVLTPEDLTEIAEQAAELVEVPEGDASAFVVTISHDGTNYTADKTNAEIYEAFQANRPVYAKAYMNDVYVRGSILSASETIALFYVSTQEQNIQVVITTDMVLVTTTEGGSEGAFVVKVTDNVADKTVAEIYEAFTQNRFIYAVVNEFVVMPLVTATEEQAIFTFATDIGGATLTIKASGELTYTETEYLTKTTPGVVKVATAEVGQTIKVKSVDKNGVPTAWEAVDMPSGGGGSGKWKQIANVTIEEAIQSVEWTTFADGTPLRASKFFVVFSLTSLAQGNTSMRVKDDSGTSYEILGPLSAKRTRLELERKADYLIASRYGYNLSNTIGSSNVEYGVHSGLPYSGSGVFTSFRLRYNSNTSMFAVGDKFDVWGYVE